MLRGNRLLRQFSDCPIQIRQFSDCPIQLRQFSDCPIQLRQFSDCSIQLRQFSDCPIQKRQFSDCPIQIRQFSDCQIPVQNVHLFCDTPAMITLQTIIHFPTLKYNCWLLLSACKSHTRYVFGLAHNLI